MIWHAVYDVSTNKLISIGTVVANPLPEGLASQVLGESKPAGSWNEATHAFDAEPEALPPTWTVYEFLKLLTPAERIAIRVLAKTDPVVEDFMDLLNRSGEVVRANPDVAGGLGYLTALGTLVEGRTAEILNG